MTSQPAAATPLRPDAEARSLALLLLAGAAILLITTIGLILPGSVFKYTEPVLEPLTVIYANTAGRIVLATTLALLCLAFGAAVYLATRLSSSPSTRLIALGGTLVLAIAFMLVYASGAQDMYHNILDIRTLWVYHDNPMITPPRVHADDPLYPFVLAWQGSVSAYGPLFYLLGAPLAIASGDDLLANVLAMKALHVVGLLAMVWLAGIAADRLSPGRGTAAMVAVGWNPFIQWEAVGNAHNDVLMMAFALAALELASRGFFSQGLFSLGLSALVKYSIAAIAPLLFLWSWRRAADSERRAVVALIFASALGAIAVYLVFPNTVHEIRHFLTTDRTWRSPIGALTSVLNEGMSDSLAYDFSRFICWALVLGAFVVSLRRLNGGARSLYQASFITLAALGSLFRPEFFTWYFLWFIPIGAVLIGGWEWRLSYLASCFGLLSYAVFPWSPNTGAANLAYVTFVLVVPVLLLGAFEVTRGNLPPSLRRSAGKPSRATRPELLET